MTVGAGLRTSVFHTDTENADGSDSFLLDSARLYVSGAATSNIKFMFNTEYNGAGNDVEMLDAVARIEVSDKFNVWFGRFLPPSDRANLYGPYYAHNWAVYTDGVQDGYPFVFQGRDNGAVYWGQFGKVKVSAGAFDGTSATGVDTLIGAGRVQLDFWDPEPGYYLNGTFYGDKNILAIAGAGQVQGSDRSAYNVDFLLERKVAGGGAVSVEAEWAKYDSLGGYNPRYGVNDGGYVLGSYLFRTSVGDRAVRGARQVRERTLPRRAHRRAMRDYNQKTTEFNFNYVMKQFNARVTVFYKDTRFDAVRANTKQIGVGMQIQM